MLVGVVVGCVLLLLLLRWTFRRSPLALRVGSTLLVVAIFFTVPIILTYLPLSKMVLICAAVGYFLAAAVRIPFMCNKPRMCMRVMQAYDYLCGGLLLLLCSLLSEPQFCRALQTKSLLSAVFERRVAHHEIMRLMSTE